MRWPEVFPVNFQFSLEAWKLLDGARPPIMPVADHARLTMQGSQDSLAAKVRAQGIRILWPVKATLIEAAGGSTCFLYIVYIHICKMVFNIDSDSHLGMIFVYID